jgi:thiamine phosphate synthase YjbQ (UPF0047 family)
MVTIALRKIFPYHVYMKSTMLPELCTLPVRNGQRLKSGTYNGIIFTNDAGKELV